MWLRPLLLLLVYLSIAFAVSPAQAAQVQLAWDPVTHPNLKGYKLYFGLQRGQYQAVDIGMSTTYTLTNLSPEKTYYFAVTAYTTTGEESEFFSELTTQPGSGMNRVQKMWAVKNYIPFERTTHQDKQDYQVEVTWEPPLQTNGILVPNPLIGYKLYYGPSSHTYSAMIPMVHMTRATVTNLSAGKTYYFTVTAFDQTGRDFDLYNEVSVTIPDNTSGVGSAVVPKIVKIPLKNSPVGEKSFIPAQWSSWLDMFQSFFDWVKVNNKAWWFMSLTAAGSFIFIYLSRICALLILGWYGRVNFAKRSRLLSPSWLITQATPLLSIVPGLGRPALFLGYKRRLVHLPIIHQASERYFGLPMKMKEEVLPYDPTGKKQHERIWHALGPKKPIVIVGKGGAGKSTLLAHLVGLTINGQLPNSLKDFYPIYVTAYYYREDFIQTIATVLRERDGVNVTKEIINTQLQSGRFLILMDGLSEVEQGDKAQVVKDILRIAQSDTYQTCRFLLATRPLESLSDDINDISIELQPLTQELLPSLIPHFGLKTADENRLTRQLRSFNNKPLDPLLLTMAITASAMEQISVTRKDLYERYFQRLLQIKPNDKLIWRGWQEALENIAEWSLLETAKRGTGLPHDNLMDRIAREVKKGDLKENLIKRLNRLYRLSIKDDLELLNKLDSAGLLSFERRWRFAHDTFEEFFAASRLVSLISQDNSWPTLPAWQGKEREFLEVFDFVAEMAMADTKTLETIQNLDLPASWRERL